MQQVKHLHEHNDHHHDHSQERLMAWLKVAILLGLGLYFAFNIMSGNLANYINARFSWLSYLAAILFLLLAGFGAFSLWRSRDHDHHHDHDHHDHHNHSHISWSALVIVAIPLILGTLIPSQPLGASAIDGNINVYGVAVTDSSSFSVNPLDRNILDWLRVFNESDDLSSFNGQEAQIVGFIYREPDFEENTFAVARFTISCCVADSSSIGLPVYWDGINQMTDGEWVQVNGTFELGEFYGTSIPVLQAQSVTIVEQPAHPYLYP